MITYKLTTYKLINDKLITDKLITKICKLINYKLLLCHNSKLIINKWKKSRVKYYILYIYYI